ncbi:MAG: hypothetical protein EAZ06_11335 [Cytophagales bacterium]|nr:MAG: hypothetical protein EAZ06_11335 [Cytophagales bacterium]
MYHWEFYLDTSKYSKTLNRLEACDFFLNKLENKIYMPFLKEKLYNKFYETHTGYKIFNEKISTPIYFYISFEFSRIALSQSRVGYFGYLTYQMLLVILEECIKENGKYRYGDYDEDICNLYEITSIEEELEYIFEKDIKEFDWALKPYEEAIKDERFRP